MNSLISTLVAAMVVSSTPAPASIETTETEPVNLIIFEQTEEERIAEEEELAQIAEEALKASKEAEEQAKFTSYTTELSSFLTTYSTSSGNYNRNYNMELASNAINGVILYPGDSFSYNDVILSARTPENDYLSAPALSNGKTVYAIGGGICQVSSTLFNAALFSGMTITQRTNHSLQVGYVPAGRDATVAWGIIDFCFRNDLDVPVMIESTIGGGALNIRFLTNQPVEMPEYTLTSGYSGSSYYLNRYADGVLDYSTYSSYRG